MNQAADDPAGLPKHHEATQSEKLVITASSLGTVFEWYDFYLYGLLATIISAQFFSGVNETTGFIFALMAFAAGFAVRPFGAIFFGRLGDLIGRKYTFLVTILIMGGSTAVVGMLPSYATIGIFAPIILIGMRLLQGLALGGEYGGAATYVAEHAPPGKRGAFTSWIQTTATVGLFLSLLVILGCRLALGPQFDVWGWRIPFLLSIVLLAVSVYIRMQLNESPVFKRMKAEGKSSKAPLTESFLRWGNLKIVLLVLFGARRGSGRRLVHGHVLRAVLPPADAEARASDGERPRRGGAHRRDDCSFQFDPIGKRKFTSSCDVAKTFLAKKAIPYNNEAGVKGEPAVVKIGGTTITSFHGTALAPAEFKTQLAEFEKQMGAAVTAAGYPAKADMSQVNYPIVIALLFVLALYVTMVYAPMAAWLVEMFPARIRYTSMSLPYHIGNGWFGGFLPTIAFAMVAATGDIYYGLWYPIVIAVMTLVIGTLFMPETHKRDLDAQDNAS